jgi:hypothetical protein
MGKRRGEYGVWRGGEPEGRNHLKDQGVDGRIILKQIFKKWDESMGWIDVAQDTNRW